jgi:hypothetical protein
MMKEAISYLEITIANAVIALWGPGLDISAVQVGFVVEMVTQFLISSFRRVLYVVCKLPGCSPAYGV